jgi:predicted dehydrogenase
MERFSPVPPATMPAIGLIGAGPWGQNILRTLSGLGVLGACADTDPAVCAQVAAGFPAVPCFHDYRALLASDMPAVAVATPANTHYQIAAEALDAGKHVFVEKPLTLDPAQAEDLWVLARRSDRVLMVGHLTLFQPAVAWIERYLADGGVGRIVSLHQERLGLGRPRTVENALWCLGSHDVALQLRLLGRVPHAIQAHGQCIVQPHVEDDVYLHLTYPDSIQTHLHVSWAWPERRRRLTVIGSDGMLQYDELSQCITLHDKAITHGLEPTDLGEETLCLDAGQPLRAEFTHFLDSVIAGRSLDADIGLAVDVVRLLAAADSQLAHDTTHCRRLSAVATAGAADEARYQTRVRSYL